METIKIKDLQTMLLPVAEEVRGKLAFPHSPVAEAHYSAMLKVLNMVLIFLQDTEKQKGEGDMKKLQGALKIEIVKMGDIPRIKKESYWQPAIKEFCLALEREVEVWEKNKNRKEEEKPALKIPIDQISPLHFSSVLNKLKEMKEVSEDFRVQVRNKEPFLVKEAKVTA